MDKKLLALLALLSIGIGLALCLCTMAFWPTPEKKDDRNQEHTTHKYEMPRFTPVVRATF